MKRLVRCQIVILCVLVVHGACAQQSTTAYTLPDLSLPPLPTIPLIPAGTSPASTAAIPVTAAPVQAVTVTGASLTAWTTALINAGYNPNSLSASDLQNVISNLQSAGFDPSTAAPSDLQVYIGADLSSFAGSLSAGISLPAMPALPALPAATPLPIATSPAPAAPATGAALTAQWVNALTNAGYNTNSISSADLQTIIASFQGIDPTVVTAAQLQQIIGTDLPTYVASLTGGTAAGATPPPVTGAALNQWTSALQKAGYNTSSIAPSDMQTIITSLQAAGIDPTSSTSDEIQAAVGGPDLNSYLQGLATTGGPGAATGGGTQGPSCSALPPQPGDATPCGMISQLCNVNPGLKVSDLIKSFIPPLVSLLDIIPPVKSFLDSATLYNFSMTPETVQSCNSFGYQISGGGAMTRQGVKGSTGLGKGGKGQYRGFEPGRTVTALEGFAHVFGQSVEVKVRFDGSNLNQNAFGMGNANVSFLLGLPTINKSVKFSAISPILAPLDNIEVLRAAVVFSTRDYQDDEWNTYVQQGVTILAEIDATQGVIGKLTKMSGFKGAKIVLKGVLATGLIGSYFQVQLQGQVNLGPLGHTTGLLNLTLYIEEIGFSIGLGGGFSVKLPKCSQPLIFQGEFRVNPLTEDILLTAWMDGMINFDQVPPLKPFSIGNVIIAYGTNLQQEELSAGLLPAGEWFIGGAYAIAGKEWSVYGGFSTILEDPEFILDIEFTGGLTLHDLVTVACEAMNALGIKADAAAVLKEIPNLGISQAKGYFCTETKTFAGRSYRQGFEILLVLIVFGKQFGFDVSLQPQVGKITAASWVQQFQLGPIYVTGRGMDMRWGTADDGPVIRFEVDVTKEPFISFFVSGLVDIRVKNLELVRALIDFFIAPIGMALEMDCKILGIYDAYVVVNALYLQVHELPGGIGKGVKEKAQQAATAAVGVVEKVTPEALSWPARNALQAAVDEQVVKQLQAEIEGTKLDTSMFTGGLIPVLPKITTSAGLGKTVIDLGNQYDAMLKKYQSQITAAGGDVDKVIAENPDFKQVATAYENAKGQLNQVQQQFNAAKAKAAASKAQQNLPLLQRKVQGAQAQYNQLVKQKAPATAINQAKSQLESAQSELSAAEKSLAAGAQ